MGAILRLLEDRASWTQGGSPQSPQYWVKKMFGALETHAGIEIDEDKALTYSPIWAAINIIAGAIGFLPMLVYKQTGEDKERAPDHNVHRLLHDRPNPYMDGQTFREALQGHVLTWGNGYAEIERDNAGRPLALWPLFPNRMVPEVIDGKLRYKYNRQDGGTSYLNYLNVLHLKGLGFDGIKGYSVIKYAANSVTVGMAAEKYGAKFFSNNATPGGVLEHPDALSDKAHQHLKEDWEAVHKGLDNVHRVAILEEGMKWHEVGIPPEDAQFLETRKFSIAEVARWYHVPPHMLAELDRATFSNIEHQGIEFVTWTLLRWFKRWENECNFKLFATDQNAYFSEFLADALLRGDTKSRYEAYRLGRMGGFLSINDIRRFENMNPIKDGDNYLEPLNMKPVGIPYVPPAAKLPAPRSTDAIRQLLEQTCGRLLTKETNALRKALKKPDEFVSRMDNFYLDFAGHIVDVLQPIMRTYLLEDQADFDFAAFAEDYIQDHRQQLIDAVDGDIEPILKSWRQDEPPALTDRLLRKELIHK